MTLREKVSIIVLKKCVYDSAANGNKGAHKEMSYNYFNNENEYLWKGAFYFEG